MSIWELKYEDCEAVVNQLRAGHSREEIATDLGITVNMVVCALRKWDREFAHRPHLS
jgi:uncharacterized protein (DUF433 family)